MIQGIDVSHWNGKIDWPKVKAAGIEFAFIKATDGVSWKDPNLSDNVAGCMAAGIPWGLYHFVRPGSMGSQIVAFKSQLEKFRGLLPPVLDVEEFGIEVPDLLDCIRSIPNAMIYTNVAWLSAQNSRGSKSLTTAPLWIAEYCPDPGPTDTGIAPWNTWTFWQFTDTGAIDGIEGDVDVDQFNGTAEDLQNLITGA